MPETMNPQEHARGDLPPALQEMRRMLDGRQMIQAFAPEIDGAHFNVLASPVMADAVIAETLRDIDLLNRTLQEAGLADVMIEAGDVSNLQTLGVKLATVSMELLQRHEAAREKEPEKDIEKVIEKVSKDYGAPWLPNIVDEADVTGEAENKEAPRRMHGELPETVKEWATKKVLVDFYAQGRSLNALGGFWAYHSDLPWQETAQDRALSAALRATNTVTAFVLAKSGISLDQAMEMAGDEGVKRLGHMRLGFDEDEEGKPKGRLNARGRTPSELAHEMIKGLLEYVVSDTSLPAVGEISEQEAARLKEYLERPATEIFEGIYGPAIARAVDGAFEKLRRDAKDDRMLEGKLQTLLGLATDEFLSDERVYLRFVKVFSMLDTEQISTFYDHCLHGEIPRALLHFLQKAKEAFR